ncbi:MAG: T9SS type A sorting domain-containing protein [Bacteroidetes bacterium]|nr:T9SS type A sorting domain-containing protein [Bacteroidota bacterium]
MSLKKYTFLLLIYFCFNLHVKAQNAYGSFAQYGIRKVNTNYTGNALQVRRNCDNAVLDIGLNSCGDLNTTNLVKFAVLANTLTGVATNAATAYSLRKLNCTYSGNAIQVRRSSDNTTKNIGFTPMGDLDTASLLSFVGGNNGFVSIWYDQSGNGRDASQAASANQPRIVNVGVIDRYNGIPSIFFNNTGASGYSICLKTANLNIYGTQACFLGVAAVKTNLTYNCLVVKTKNNNYPSPFDFYCASGTTTTLLTGNGTSANFFTCSKNFNAAAGLNIWTYQAKGTSANGVNAYYDAATQIVTNQTATFYGDNNTPVYLGARSDGVTGLNGWISEVLTFATIPTPADINFLQYTEGTYYNIIGPTFSTPSNATSLNAYISKWYDQSGNGYDASQATAANQPLIVNAAVINTQNGYPSILFGTSSSYLNTPYTGVQATTAGNQTTANFVLQSTSGITGTLFSNGAAANASRYNIHAPWNDNNTYWDIGTASSGGRMSGPLTWTSLSTGTFRRNAAQGDVWQNGTNSLTNSGLSTSCTNNTNIMTIGGNPIFNSYMQGNISEINVFGSPLSTTQRVLEETNQGTYYGIPISGSQYAASPGYIYYVNGVGKTNSTDSVAATRQSGGMGFIIGTTASDYLKDNGDYLTAGMTCPTAAVTTSLYMPTGATAGYERWLNDWYINKTDILNNGGTIQIYFDFKDYGVSGAPGVASNYQLWGRGSTTSNFTVVPTSSTIVLGTRVVFTLPAANIGTTGYYTLGSIDYQKSPLPIQLLSFTADAENNTQVNVQWVTASEVNNDYFTIERSRDGQTFYELNTLKSKAPQGNSLTSLHYQLYDNQPFSGTSYYRLKQTDYNGKSEAFNIVSVNINSDNKNLFNVFPNPNNGVFTVQYAGGGNTVSIQIYNTLGSLLMEKEEVITNNNYSTLLNTLDAGVYVLRCSIDGGNPQVVRLIVQK